MLFLWESGGKESRVTDLIYMLAVLRPYSALMSEEYVVRDWQLGTGSKLESSWDNLNNNKQFQVNHEFGHSTLEVCWGFRGALKKRDLELEKKQVYSVF